MWRTAATGGRYIARGLMWIGCWPGKEKFKFDATLIKNLKKKLIKELLDDINEM